jgi:hypothetical protein
LFPLGKKWKVNVTFAHVQNTLLDLGVMSILSDSFITSLKAGRPPKRFAGRKTFLE